MKDSRTFFSEKQIIERARFLIQDEERSGATISFLAPWHRENIGVLQVLLAAYIQLNALEKESLRCTGMFLCELIGIPVDANVQPPILREKHVETQKRFLR